jgi:pimeloyl-ACP methyl ester carboxylesterase
VIEAFIYLHGGPGSPNELSLFDEEGSAARPLTFAPDRFALYRGCDASAAFDQLAVDCIARFPQAQFHLVGFSLGGYVALELANRLGTRVSRIDLIAPAAPLEGGGFLEKMAGKPLFTVARDHPAWLLLVLRVQGFLARAFPGLLYRLLFASAAGGDRALVSTLLFKSRLVALLQSSFHHSPAGFARELKAYVSPWGHILPMIVPPVRLWHGTEDNWAPFAMSEYLVAALPNSNLETVKGASHYSTLKVALLRIE